MPEAQELPWRVRKPVVTLLVLLGAIAFGIDTNQYAFAFQLGVPVGIMLAGAQSAALVWALWEPIPAWWLSTVTMLAGAWIATALHGDVNPTRTNLGAPGWTAITILVQSGILLILALRLRPRVAMEALGLSLFAGLLAELYRSPDQGSSVGAAVVLFSVAVLIGSSLRGLRAARTELVAQEELTAEERARRTVLEERSRIARELHDVVAHHMSVISIQAQVAPHLVEDPSQELRETLDGIRQNAVEALAELRRVLGVLRAESPLGGGVDEAPQPTLARLPELLNNVRGAGLTVEVAVTGEERPLAPGVELSAYRIVQEAVSNAMRHAPDAAVAITLDYRPAALGVAVVNEPPRSPAPPSPGAGHGLLGMRERAAMLGGELTAGPTPQGGYRVAALLPVAAAPVQPSLEDRT
ncbi:sensor histidine kinase [Streptacidiphilus sp. NEAU-YB345]|uniref:histidine kinase n=2 Tax=Streptacidiphilus fuscans TaxID=2789292 RepID=A0A931B874_9ACTN|nr:sensor histidine kinase [Streptacidiphilus fuscans]